MGCKVILPELVLLSRVDQRWKFSGIDHVDHCRDKQHFLSYPHDLSYIYNSRGFRDQEWPSTVQELRNAIWCIGDSFTVGLGSPLEHTWPFQLSKLTNQRTINVSMDGASNEWIARVTQKIVQAVDPAKIVIMWSYTQRREKSDITLCDEDRRMQFDRTSDEQDWENFLNCYNNINLISSPVQFAVPNFHPTLLDVGKCWQDIKGVDWPDAPQTLAELHALPASILSEIDTLHNCLERMQQALCVDVVKVHNKDLARDGHHFDLITAEWIAGLAANQLNQL